MKSHNNNKLSPRQRQRNSPTTSPVTGAAAAAARGTIPTSITKRGNNNNHMIEIGLDIGITEADKEKRMKRGECPSCGIKLYKVTGIGLLSSRKKHTPLTIQGLVHNGRCLQCQPVRALPNAKGGAATRNGTGGFLKTQSITRERGQLSGLSDEASSTKPDLNHLKNKKTKAAAHHEEAVQEEDELKEEEDDYFDEVEEEDYDDVRYAGIPRFLPSDISIGEISAITLDHRFAFHGGGRVGSSEAFQEENDDDEDVYREQQQQTGTEQEQGNNNKPYNSDDDEDEEEHIRKNGGRPRPEPDGRSSQEPPPQLRRQQLQPQEAPEEIQSYRSLNCDDDDDDEEEAVQKSAARMMQFDSNNNNPHYHSPGGGAAMRRSPGSGSGSPHSMQQQQLLLQRQPSTKSENEESKHEIASPRNSHAVFNPPWAATSSPLNNKNSVSVMGSGGGFVVDENITMISPQKQHQQQGRMRGSSQSEIFFDSSRLCDLETAEQLEDGDNNEQQTRHHDSSSSNRHQYQANNRSSNKFALPSPPLIPIEQEIHLLPEFLPMDHDLIPPAAAGHHRHESFNSSHSSQQRQQQQQRYTERDIPTFLTVLKKSSRNQDWTSCIEALQGLTLVIWKSSSSAQAQRTGGGSSGGGEAKRIFAQGRGIDRLNEIMWSDFTHEELQQAAFDLFLALAAFPECSNHSRSAPGAFSTDRHQDDDGDDNVLVGEAAQNLVDALLLAMRELSDNETIQQTGCRILLCLARASGTENAEVHDGSMAGSVEVVLQAMQRHGSSSTSGGGGGGKNSIVPAVQEWGIRTLYQQCTTSRHAESNKRTLLRWNNYNSNSGVKDNNDSADNCNGGEVTTGILLQAMEHATQDAVKLYWCLTSSEDIAAMLSPKAATETMTALLRYVHRAIKKEQAIMTSASTSRDDDFVIDLATENGDLLIILEASLATISNLVRIPENGNALRPTLVAMLTLDILQFHRSAIDRLLGSRDAAIIVDDVILMYCNNYLNLCTEASGLVANLANLDNFDKEEILQAGGIHRLVRALTVRPAISTSGDSNSNSNDNRTVVEALHEEAIRALLCLAVDSEPVKSAIVGDGELFTTILQTFQIYERSAPWQEMLCRLLASLFSRRNLPPDGSMLANDGLDAICAAMSLHADSERVQETACLALRNMASREEQTELLLRSEAVGLAVDAMSRYDQSRTIQTHVSGILWSLGIRAAEACGDGGNTAIQCIITALQYHLEDSALLEMACGALLGLIFNSETRKLQVGKEGVEAIIICGLVMHQHDLNILEKACELLACLSVVAALVPSIVDAQGVVNIVEAMRNHASSINLLRSGALCLKNIIIALPNVSDEAGGAVSATINAIATHVDDAAFQREACNFLWAVSVQSEDAKSKILALDGLAVLMDITLEQHANAPDVQAAALGAVNELMVINTTVTTTMPNVDEGNRNEEVRV